MPREAIPSYYFVLCVVRKGDRFLLVHERKHGQLWYWPGGGIEPGEDVWTAARRETMEEAGIPIEIDGILRVEHTPHADYTRVRFILLAHPADDTPPKSEPDEETLGAAWVALEELADYPLRGQEVADWFRHVADGGDVAPLDLLGRE